MDSLTENEIGEFKGLEDVHVVFDVGVRESVDYLTILPKAEFHLFEPVESIFHSLKAKIKLLDRTGQVHLNNYGLGDIDKRASFNFYLQCFIDGPARPGWGGDKDLEIKTLDGYIKEKGVTRIDFLKIDTEGYDLKVLQGGPKALAMTRYLQFETWDNLDAFKELLGDKWIYKDIGARNIFCRRKPTNV